MDISMAISVIGLALYLICSVCLCFYINYDATKAICSNLYSKTANYETCMGKNFQDIAKLIKPIDTEVINDR